jgi:hypothetical protein
MLDRIIEELYREKVIRNIITNMNVFEGDIDDLEQEVFTILLEYDVDKIIEMYNKKQLKFFIVGIVTRQYFSKTSPFYKKYKKYYSLVDSNVDETSVEC